MNFLKNIFSFSVAMICIATICYPVSASVRPDTFIRSGQQYLVAGPELSEAALGTLARFDLLVLPAEAQNFNPQYSAQLRAINPDIIILAYVPTVSYNDRYWSDALHLKLKNRLSSSMELKHSAGNQVSIWPQTSAYNVANKAYRDAWVDYVEKDVWSSGYWDGIFLDEVASTISWVGDTDINNDGRVDTGNTADNAWHQGNIDLFSRTRKAVGNDAILITNGSSNDSYQPHVNGRMFESFPTPWEGQGRWEDSMQSLINNADANNGHDDVFFVNADTGETGIVDHRQVRFTLTSAMLGGAFFGYGHGQSDYTQLFHFDEYDAFLGRMVDAPRDELTSGNTRMKPSVWSREFQQGKIIVNATDAPHTIFLGSDFEKINGTQDRSVNNGRIVDEVTVAARDGIVLIRPIEDLLNAQFSNGSFVRIFNKVGGRDRTGFFAYTGATLGGDNVVYYDFDNDGIPEIVSATDSKIRIHDNKGAIVHEFYPYDEAYSSGINLAIGDLEGDGRVEIVTGTKNGGGPHIRIFNQDGRLIHPGFFAFHPLFRGGVNLTLGDIDGDGRDEIIAGAGVGGGPQVQTFNKDGRLLNPGFFAYDKQFRGGVNVAAGDVTGDGKVDIITGPGLGGPPTVRVFDGNGTSILPEFDAFESYKRKGVFVAAEDLDGDNIAEIMALTTDVFTLSGN
ncbi:hypothetical protein HOI83_02755 [Candidatus Uhrbacteria bacterium]|jgi:hypothetical protein|nr:hypothetical protein [Candidatus Uhrbacteria bacterium]